MNIHRGRGQDGEKDLRRTSECLTSAQIVALNEVGGQDDARELASLLSLTPLFAATERFFWQEDFGNALLSPVPPQSWERIPLPYADEGGWRNLLIARWPWGERQLTVMITHLDRGSARGRQLALVIEQFRALAAPKLLLGDLNSQRDEPLLAALLADPSLAVADPGEGNRIDWIIGQGVTFSAVRACDVGASDHPALLTQMTINP